MDISVGSVVKSKAGRDKEAFFVVLELRQDRALIADGRERKVEKPKLKNLRHLSPTETKVLLPQTNKQLRKLLNNFGTQED